MKNLKNLIVCIIFSCFCTFVWGQDFSLPEPGTIIEGETILGFDVMLNISNYDSNKKYWVAIATVKGHKNTWRSLTNCLRNNCSEAEKKGLMNGWQIDKFWPKFEVLSQVHAGQIFGSLPPDSNYHPRIIVLIEANAQQHQYFSNWMNGPFFPGIPGAYIRKGKKEELKIFYRR